jgi:hypothetical protein
VSRIHDILGWIRIRILGSMPLTNGFGSGSWSCYIRHWHSRCQQKTNFLTQFFCLLFFEVTFTSFFKDKKSKRVTKYYESRFFLLFLHDEKDPDPESDPDPYPCLVDPDPGGPKQNMWIRIRIRNTTSKCSEYQYSHCGALIRVWIDFKIYGDTGALAVFFFSMGINEAYVPFYT